MTIRVVELFAGVGGFRIGLEGYPRKPDSPFKVVWSNQFEPATKTQYANLVYNARWPNANHSEKDIRQVINDGLDDIPDHDILVAGFPCQDFSVANSLKNSLGLKGAKGQLWWSIHKILKDLGSRKPKYLLLENVDRLISSPAHHRGKDFAIILSCLNELGYGVEWRIINAADYGMPQKRKRIFMLAYQRKTAIYIKMDKHFQSGQWLMSEGVFARAFPVIQRQINLFADNLNQIQNAISVKKGKTPFGLAGAMVNGKLLMSNAKPLFLGSKKSLGDVLIPNDQVPEGFFIPEAEITKEKGWAYQKGAKRIQRLTKSGKEYIYSEGAMNFPDPLDAPSRTIVTGEGGTTPSRSKHVVKVDGRYRRLVPLELERLNVFPDNHTLVNGISDNKRAFLMGNALVVGIVRKIGNALTELVS